MKSLTYCLLGSLTLIVPVQWLPAQQPSGRSAEQPRVTPWGISSSASSFRNHEEWFPKLAEAGISTVRLFPEWRGFETQQGTWNWQNGDLLMKSAAAHQLEINAILMGSPPGTKAIHAFPMENLDDWSAYVSAVVGRYKKQIHYWEVWNEGNGGFNDGHHTTRDYARLAMATYEAAKQAAPDAKVGLTVASFDAPYLDQTVRTMAEAGKPNSFDYLCIHPYEIADGLADTDGEIPFLWMNRTLRNMLRDAAPARANAEIWMTEVGHRIAPNADRSITEQDAAQALAKMYTMAIAQGITCTQWFEAQDPAGEDQGFGLLSRDGKPRPAYKTFKAMTKLLGRTPKYQGWLTVGGNQRGYGFVFEGTTAPVLVAWMPVGLSSEESARSLSFSQEVTITNAVSLESRELAAGKQYVLSETPVFISGLPQEFVKEALANAKRAFPWGGDYSSAETIRFEAGLTDQRAGVFPRNRAAYPTIKFDDGSEGLLVRGDIGHPISFYAHPSFASFQTRDYYVRVTVRRVAAGNVGMNLRYEVANSQGRSPYANVGQWFGVTQEQTWQTYTWHAKDACFSKMWGYDVVIHPEQSIPFVLGKLEISTKPFE